MWSTSRRVAFRFSAIYVLLFASPFPFDLITLGWGDRIDKAARVPWYSIVPWVGAHVLHLHEPVAIVRHGLNDAMFYWVKVFAIAAFALIASVVWTLAARSSRSNPRLAAALRIFIRYYVATWLISYGFYKVLKTQFPAPGPEVLMRQYGDSTPSRLLSTFMGYSTGYTMFAGIAECVGGVLLFWRRTTLLGALVCLAVMLNVVMLNFCYGFPLKLFTLHLLAMTIALIAPDAKRLASFFLMHRAARPTQSSLALPRRWQLARNVLKPIAVIGILVQNAIDVWPQWHSYGDAGARPWFFGLYEVETFASDGVVAPPLTTNTTRWQRIAFNDDFGGVERMDRHVEKFPLDEDATHKTLTLGLQGGDVVFNYERADAEHLVLDGLVDAHAIHLELRRIPLDSMRLTQQRFRWVINKWEH